ncbi:DUF853 family protein, partial [Leptospira sp. 96542]|nr:DUF853 family protein [Leptospira sp. 96542]
VGVYFVTQHPLDIPDTVLGQLGNRVQHALRAYTPRDQKAVKTAADTMRPNPALGDMARAITELGVGEALISFLDDKGRPGVTERAWVLPPGSQIGPVTPAQRQALMASSLVAGVYEKTQDRESAFEKLAQRTQEKQAQQVQQAQAQQKDDGGLLGGLGDLLGGGPKQLGRASGRGTSAQGLV